MLDTAFEALMKYDYGTDLKELNPIEDAVATSHGNEDARRDLEQRLITALKGNLSRDAQDYACRKLAIVGTAASVPVLEGLLIAPETSHMSRFALERIPAEEAAHSLRNALSKADAPVKVGLLSSLGQRRDAGAVEVVGMLIKNSDAAVARAAALALGAIGTAEASAVLQSALKEGANTTAVVDALLSCAESLLAGNKMSDARSIYQKFSQENQPRLVRLAGTRGLLACASRQI